jgi:hypothetical protein
MSDEAAVANRRLGTMLCPGPLLRSAARLKIGGPISKTTGLDRPKVAGRLTKTAGLDPTKFTGRMNQNI